MHWKSLVYRSLWQGLDLIFPPSCGGCKKQGSSWCLDCQKKTRPIRGPLCQVCGILQPSDGVCFNCQSERPAFHELRSWAIFDEPVRSALHHLKYRHDVSLGNSLAWELLDFVRDLKWDIDLLVPIPLGKKRLKERGYNQSAAIAFPLALGLDIKYRPHLLIRTKETRTQVGLTKMERRENIHNAFAASSEAQGRTVLVFDDVATTGSTLSSAATAFHSAGAKKVYALTAARALTHQITLA